MSKKMASYHRHVFRPPTFTSILNCFLEGWKRFLLPNTFFTKFSIFFPNWQNWWFFAKILHLVGKRTFLRTNIFLYKSFSKFANFTDSEKIFSRIWEILFLVSFYSHYAFSWWSKKFQKFQIQNLILPDIPRFGHLQLANKRLKNSRMEWMIFLPYYKYRRKILQQSMKKTEVFLIF